MKKIVLPALTCVLLAAACGPEPAAPPAGKGLSERPPPSEQRYRGAGIVLEERGAEPVLCLGVVLDSLPPQCGGLQIDGWDWDAVAGEESAGGTTWGSYEVTGLYDGATFTLLEARPPGASPPDDDPITSACPEPAGGWDAPNPGMSSSSDRGRAMAAARRELDIAGAWIDYIGEPSEFADDAAIILNLAFTGDIQRHEEEIRELWGGPLCVVRHERTLKRLRQIQDELSGSFGENLGLEILWSSSSETGNFVEIGVVVTDEATERKIAERYGVGTVKLTPQLHPVP